MSCVCGGGECVMLKERWCRRWWVCAMLKGLVVGMAVAVWWR